MIKSMTGYGRGEVNRDGWQVTAEIKAVNHRYLEVVVRMPRNYLALEDRVRKVIQEKVIRGRVDIFIAVEQVGEKNRNVKVDKELAVAYYNSLKDLAILLQATSPDADLYQIARFPEVLVAETPEEDLEATWLLMQEAVRGGVQQLLAMRATEGEKLANDINMRVDQIAGMMETIEERAPLVPQEYKDKLVTRINESFGDLQLDESRLLAEIALFADRINITEELIRLASHLQQVKTAMGAAEQVGRKLDFLAQEINREVNTIGSKANDLTITRAVVDMKSELEKIREQVQNIE